MTLEDELGLNQPFHHPSQQVVLGVMLTGQMLAKEGSRLLRPFKLTDTQFNVLMLLRHQTDVDGALSQTRLGRMLLVNRSNVTGLVERLELSGLLERAPGDADRRVKRVRLTDTGRRLVDRAGEAYFKRLEELTASLGEAELRQVAQTLEQLRANVKAPGNKPVR